MVEAPLYQSTCWFSATHEIQDWMDGGGRSVSLMLVSNGRACGPCFWLWPTWKALHTSAEPVLLGQARVKSTAVWNQYKPFCLHTTAIPNALSTDTGIRRANVVWRIWTPKVPIHIDNISTWLQTGAFLIALKIWQQNASGFRRYDNYPREVTAPGVQLGYYVTCWPLVLAAPYLHTLANHSGSAIGVSESHSINSEHRYYELFQTLDAINNHHHCSMSTVVPLHLLFTTTKQLPTWPFAPIEIFLLVCKGDCYLC